MGSTFAICSHQDNPTLEHPNILLLKKVGYCRLCLALPETRLLSEICSNGLAHFFCPSFASLISVTRDGDGVFLPIFSRYLDYDAISMIGVKKPVQRRFEPIHDASTAPLNASTLDPEL